MSRLALRSLSRLHNLCRRLLLWLSAGRRYDYLRCASSGIPRPLALTKGRRRNRADVTLRDTRLARTICFSERYVRHVAKYGRRSLHSFRLKIVSLFAMFKPNRHPQTLCNINMGCCEVSAAWARLYDLPVLLASSTRAKVRGLTDSNVLLTASLITERYTQARSHGGARGGWAPPLEKFEPPLAGLGCPPWHFIGIGFEVYSPPLEFCQPPPTNDTWLRRWVHQISVMKEEDEEWRKS